MNYGKYDPSVDGKSSEEFAAEAALDPDNYSMREHRDGTYDHQSREAALTLLREKFLRERKG